MKITSADFSARLRKCARRMHIKQTHVAKSLGIPNGTISRYFTGSSMPKAIELYRIARLLNVSMEWLLTGEESPLSANPNPNEKASDFLSVL
jgi:transcriptional regulator with XRE-family HTH domain